MPKRRLPRTDAQRHSALRNAKKRKDRIPPPVVIPFTAATILRLDTFQPIYKTKYDAVDTAKNTQTTLTATVNNTRKLAIYNEQDFIEALNRAIRRELFLPTVRTLYKLAVDDTTLPYIGSENDVITWGENIESGETARIAAGGAPITFPSLADVNAAVAAFDNANALQANAKEAFDAAQELLEVENPEADKLILKLWNEIETAFDEGDKASMRRKAREWGVVYIPSPGEVISPDDFSITGKITDAVTGTALNEVLVTVIETGAEALSESNGDYFVSVQPPGTYTLLVEKTGYYPLTIPNVQVTAGSLTTKNIPLLSQTNSGNTVVVSGNYLSPETVTANMTGVNTTPVSVVGVEVFNSPAGFFASETDAGLPIGIRYDRNQGTIIYLLVEDFKALIGYSPTKQVIRVQNIGMVPGSYALTFMNLE